MKKYDFYLFAIKLTPFWILLLILIILLPIKFIPEWKTTSYLDKAVDSAIVMDFQDGYVFLGMEDSWGNSIILSRTISSDKKHIIYMVVSPGINKIFGDHDDIKRTKFAVNQNQEIETSQNKGWYDNCTENERLKNSF